MPQRVNLEVRQQLLPGHRHMRRALASWHNTLLDSCSSSSSSSFSKARDVRQAIHGGNVADDGREFSCWLLVGKLVRSIDSNRAVQAAIDYWNVST